MYYVNSGKKTNFSFLTVTILLLAFVSATFGTINTSANSGDSRQVQANRLSLQNGQLKETVYKREAARFDFR